MIIRTVLYLYKTLLCAMSRPPGVTHALHLSLRQGVLARAGKLPVLQLKEAVRNFALRTANRVDA
jgi:hypothetical protein